MTTAVLNKMMCDINFQMGQLSARTEMMAEQHHTCQLSYLRYPWPPDPKCPGCQHEIQKWVRRLHLEMPYRLFGPQCVIDAAERAIQRKIEQAEARRNMGAFI